MVKIEVGKQYKTRDGKIIEILKTDSPHTAYPVIGYNVTSGEPFSFTLKGEYMGDGHINPGDIVSEHREPFSWEGWILERDGEPFDFHKIEPDMIDLEGNERLIKVRITEIQEED